MCLGRINWSWYLVLLSYSVLQVLDADKSAVLGKISKVWSGLDQELFSNADNFKVTCQYNRKTFFLFVCLLDSLVSKTKLWYDVTYGFWVKNILKKLLDFNIKVHIYAVDRCTGITWNIRAKWMNILAGDLCWIKRRVTDNDIVSYVNFINFFWFFSSTNNGHKDQSHTVRSCVSYSKWLFPTMWEVRLGGNNIGSKCLHGLSVWLILQYYSVLQYFTHEAILGKTDVEYNFHII